MVGIWDERFTVRSFDLDQHGRLTPIALFSWMLETAGQHATQLGWGIHDLQRRGLTWMLARFRLEISALPGWGESVTVRTWPSGVDRLFAMRELRALAGSGEVLARATSAWLLLHQSTRRPLRPGQELAFLAASTPGRTEELAVAALPELGETVEGATFTARAFDLDVNGHVTAATLARWVLESLPAGVLLETQLHSLHLDLSLIHI
jgi:acyl-ACP thioesterase